MKYDVVIIGAGPAGASLGYRLSKEGLDIALIDRAYFPREKLCGGFLTSKTIDIISEMGLPAHDLGSRIEAVHVFYKGELSSSFNLLSPTCVVRRREFDLMLLNASIAQNTSFFGGSELKCIDFSHKTVYLKSGDSLQYDKLVGADGALSRVRRFAGVTRNSVGFCVESFTAPEQIIPNALADMRSIGIYYGDYSKGYNWIFPNQNTIAVGTGSLTEDFSAQDILTQYKAFASKVQRQDCTAVRGAYIPSGNSVILGTDEVFFVGDAAGLTDPLTGEGIYYALLSSKYLAESIMSGDDPLSAYNSKMESVLKDISENVQMRNKIYSPLVFKNAIASMQSIPQFSETLIDQTILRYEKSYSSAYDELTFYSR